MNCPICENRMFQNECIVCLSNERKLNFGCGNEILKDYENVDKKDFDFNKMPYPYKDQTFNLILVKHVLEHLEKPREVIKELIRITKPNGIIKIIVPYYNCRSALTDITHKHYFSDKTFENIVFGYDYEQEKDKLNVEIQEIYLKPTMLGRFMPFRYKASMVLGEIYSEIHITLKVI